MESGPYFESFWLLCGMGMVAACIHLELLKHCIAERTFGQHTLDCNLKHPSRVARMQLAERSGINAAWVSAMAMIKFVVRLVARDAQLVDVDHHDKVTAIDVWRKFRLV